MCSRIDIVMDFSTRPGWEFVKDEVDVSNEMIGGSIFQSRGYSVFYASQFA
jgi:hypothetical protein